MLAANGQSAGQRGSLESLACPLTGGWTGLWRKEGLKRKSVVVTSGVLLGSSLDGDVLILTSDKK